MYVIISMKNPCLRMHMNCSNTFNKVSEVLYMSLPLFPVFTSSDVTGQL